MNLRYVLPFILTAAPLLAEETGLKLRFGVSDKEATDWSGTVTVSPGRVALISGWRFAQQDKADGTTGWSCRTRPAVLQRQRSNNPKREQQARANAPTALP